ncbi:MAG: SDR family oxidoreductase [Gammaproteobacteria bacterium]|jgi:NAD(P)-dependent dehydrogenase (short-subunit alcohol dehydrogenase family)|nr:SDR family oxidoreductase [Gammaproteobacteria bacterium]MDP6617246.1 SDR family oxidoreductase [Gammaproteobacteria bacterium]MDP6695832.1 SDR family oxidoreductase [Gammaproteobacteria bacterium]
MSIHRTAALLLFALFTSTGNTAEPSDNSATYKPTVLITGSNRGIGFEFVRRLAGRDWRIIATTRNPDGATTLAELAADDPDIIIEQLDVTSNEDIAALARKYSEQPIDILLLNAARGPGSGTALSPLSRLDWDLADSFFQVNAIGPMKVAQALMENVKASQMKQVIVMSSDSGSFVAGSQLPILYHYKASKAALNMYFHTLAFETKKRGVTVVMLHPGLVGTNEQLAKMPGSIKTEASVSQMLTVMDGLTLDDNGQFISYEGESMPW